MGSASVRAGQTLDRAYLSFSQKRRRARGIMTNRMGIVGEVGLVRLELARLPAIIGSYCSALGQSSEDDRKGHAA